jgi:hypothetical protein
MTDLIKISVPCDVTHCHYFQMVQITVSLYSRPSRQYPSTYQPALAQQHKITSLKTIFFFNPQTLKMNALLSIQILATNQQQTTQLHIQEILNL